MILQLLGEGLSVFQQEWQFIKGSQMQRSLSLKRSRRLLNHQTGHNSGVIHSGIYYKPGSFKARFARQGSQSMTEFCQTHGIQHDICGKVIVATKPEEIPLLENLYKRGLDNGLSIHRIGPEELKEIEPHVKGLWCHSCSNGWYRELPSSE